ncbi:hypothetical protein Tco_1457751 [Tanacetum coccineum]
MLLISDCSIGRFWNNCFNSGIDIWDCNMIYGLKECEFTSRVLIGGSDGYVTFSNYDSLNNVWVDWSNDGTSLWDCHSTIMHGIWKLLRNISKRRRFLVLSTKMSMKVWGRSRQVLYSFFLIMLFPTGFYMMRFFKEPNLFRLPTWHFLWFVIKYYCRNEWYKFMQQKMFSNGMLYLVYVASMSLFYAYVILIYLASLCMAYLKELAYGDGLMQADWSQLALMIQSMLLFLNKF